ncbi:hypothetical protein HMPREF0204_10848 [Chryseobacterium gleum ATCC 35910]|uniref:Uncharacterized protein n=1 Tax=Chryseobacterium gleum ATCC 35910 TaxID=525257 RepID=A0ABP2IT74_CHRGE|nr:hypothetical protein HMPREF0204_10848 [Chryseobacterium gleum ATCC 35910]
MKVQIFKKIGQLPFTQKMKKRKRTVRSRRSLVNKNRQPFTFLNTTLGNEKGLSGAEDLYKH